MKRKWKRAVCIVSVMLLSILVVFSAGLPVWAEETDGDSEVLEATSYKVGDIIKFGHYEQDGNTSNGKEEIEWEVLKVEYHKILVASKYALDCKPYNAERNDVTWEYCSLRGWLNNDFKNSAFTSEELKKIPVVTVVNDNNPRHKTPGGNITQDQIFCLSLKEINDVVGHDSYEVLLDESCQKAIVEPTKFAIENGVNVKTITESDYNTYLINYYPRDVIGRSGCWWWLRTPGMYSNSACAIAYSGGCSNFYVDYNNFAVRPALYITVPGLVPESGVEINSMTFPDEKFRSFAASNYDKDNDTFLSAEELNDVRTISCAGCEIKSLKGIENFTNLEVLECQNNQLSELDLSSNTNLAELICHNNKLETLNIAGCRYLYFLFCYENQLSKLDLSGNPNIESLACGRNILKTINITNCNKIKWLTCEYNQLEELDLSSAPNIEYLDCCDNQICDLDLSSASQLESLYCFDNKLTKLDISKCQKLKDLACGDNALKLLDTSHNIELEDIQCGRNQLTSLNLTNNVALVSLACFENSITELNLSQNAKLESLCCQGNPMSSVDVSYNTELTNMACYECGLENLDISKNLKLKSLWCFNNKLTALDISKNLFLDVLIISSNNLKALDISNNPRLYYLCIEKNPLTKIDISKNERIIDVIQKGVKEVKDNTISYTDNSVLEEGLPHYFSFDEDDQIIFDGETVILPDSISLDKATETMYYGESVTLTATLTPSDVTKKTITWTSSNPTIATVNNGTVKPTSKGAGVVTITAKTVNGLTATCEVKVFADNNPENIFADIKMDTWQYKAAKPVYDKGYMTGKGELEGRVLFSPDTNIDRSQFVVALYSMDGKPETEYEQKFSDVKSSAWYAKQVTWASNNGIVAGNPDGTFGVYGKATREQLALMFYKYAMYKNYDVSVSEETNLDRFTDAGKVSSWAVTAIKWAVERGIISGKGSETAGYRIDPTSGATRAECAAMIKKFSEINDGMLQVVIENEEEPLALPKEEPEDISLPEEEMKEDIIPEEEPEDSEDDIDVIPEEIGEEPSEELNEE